MLCFITTEKKVLVCKNVDTNEEVTNHRAPTNREYEIQQILLQSFQRKISSEFCNLFFLLQEAGCANSGFVYFQSLLRCLLILSSIIWLVNVDQAFHLLLVCFLYGMSIYWNIH